MGFKLLWVDSQSTESIEQVENPTLNTTQQKQTRLLNTYLVSQIPIYLGFSNTTAKRH
jgi:hypothetical protein